MHGTVMGFQCLQSSADMIEMPFWVVGSNGPTKSCVRWGLDPHDGKGKIVGKGAPTVKYRDTLRSPVRKQLNRWRCRLDCVLGLAKES